MRGVCKRHPSPFKTAREYVQGSVAASMLLTVLNGNAYLLPECPGGPPHEKYEAVFING